MKITLPIHGRERTFSEKELIAILEKYFSNEATEQATTAKVAQVPTEDQWFEVNPQTINQSLFKKKRKDERQERTRKLILEAFAEVDKHPEKYASAFYTLMPEKKWNDYKTVAELKAYANDLDGQMADWVEQALEWAQRLFNGESWETICNNADTANWYRVILWENGCYRLVGGSRNNFNDDPPASGVFNYDFASYSFFLDTVPLVVLKKK